MTGVVLAVASLVVGVTVSVGVGSDAGTGSDTGTGSEAIGVVEEVPDGAGSIAVGVVEEVSDGAGSEDVVSVSAGTLGGGALSEGAETEALHAPIAETIAPDFTFKQNGSPVSSS